MTEKLHTSYEELVAHKLMDTVALNSKFSIGVISHNDELKRRIDEGVLGRFFNEFAALYRGIYAGEPWNEYLICTNDDCGKKTGLPTEASLEKTDEEFNANPEKNCCPDCKSPMKLFYEPTNIEQNFVRVFKEKIFASLLFSHNDISTEMQMAGFSLGWETTVHDGYKDKMIIGAGDLGKQVLTYDEYFSEFREHLGKTHTEHTPVFNSAELAIAQKARDARASYPLLNAVYTRGQQNLAVYPGQEIPVIGHTLSGSKAEAIFKKVGFTTGMQKPGSEEVRVYSTLPRLIAGTQKYISTK